MSQRLPRLIKVAFGAGDLGFSLTSTIVGTYFAIFLTDAVGIAPAVAAIAIFLGRTWDYVNDPLIGYLSDRTRTRWGRRRPYLLFGAIPFAAVFTLMWWRPPLSGIGLAVYYAAAYILFDTGATLVYMPYFALTPELTSDYDERTSLTTYRMFFSIFGSLLAFTLPSLIVGDFRAENATRILANGALFGLVSALPLIMLFFVIRERKDYAEAPQPKLLASLKSAMKNPPFLFGLGIYLFTWFTMDIMQGTILYYLTYCVRRQDQSAIFMAAIFVTAILSLPLWNWISGRWNKKTAYIGGVAFWAVVQLLLVTLGPGSGMVVILALCVLAGIGVGAAHVLPWSILPDAVEWDEWKTGERHEGTYYSLVTLAQKIASSFAIPLVLLVLGISGYRAGSTEQPASVVLAIRLVTGPLPAAVLCLGILCAALYPMSRQMHARILAEIEGRKGGAP